MKTKLKIYYQIFTSMVFLSAFTFGGGYVIISLMQAKFVEELQWIDEEEMLNFAAIAQASPGAVAVNAAILVGYRVAGVMGAVVSILGTIIPPIAIISIISFFYTAFRTNLVVSAVLKGMQAGVAAVIADVVLNLGGSFFKGKDYLSIFVMVIAFVATYFLNINVMLIILICAISGVAIAWYSLREEIK